MVHLLVLTWLVAFSRPSFLRQDAKPADVERQSAPAEGTEPALAPGDMDALELLRFVLADEGREAARELLHEMVAELTEPEANGEAAHIAFLLALNKVAEDLGSLSESVRLLEQVLALRTRRYPADHTEILAAQQGLGAARYALGDLEGARTLFEAVHASRARQLPPDDFDLLEAKLNLAAIRRMSGDLTGARELAETVVEAWKRLLPPDHSNLLKAMQSLAILRSDMGDLDGALELAEAALAGLSSRLPPDNNQVIVAKLNLATMRGSLGDLAGALELEEAAVEVWTQQLPRDHPHLLAAMGNLASTRAHLGDLRGARALQEDLLETLEAQFPADYREVLTAKLALAHSRRALGDLAGALELEESVIEAWTRIYPPDHPDLLKAKLGLASTRGRLGDIAGELEIEQQVLEIWSRQLPPDHPDLQVVKQNLASSRHRLGDLAGARELEEAVLEARMSSLPPDHPDLLVAKQNLALTLFSLGELRRAGELQEAVLEARKRILPPDHPDLLAAMGNLASTRRKLGDLTGAAELEELVLATWSNLLDPDSVELLIAEQNLAVTRRELGDPRAAAELASSLLSGLRLRAGKLRAESARAAREGVRQELMRFSTALACAAGDSDGLRAELFATLESLRLASVASSEVARAKAEMPELEEGTRRLAEVRARLNDLVAVGPRPEDDPEQWRKEIVELSEERDRLDRDARRRLAGAGTLLREIDAPRIGARLAAGTAAVAFLRYTRWFDVDPETGKELPGEGSLLAFVVQPGGAVTRVELGSATEMEALVEDWRSALGRPLTGRGVGVDAGGSADRLETAGRKLRERLLDPVLAIAVDVHALHVEPDDVLHLVPLDALPLEGRLVGERIAIHDEVTLGRLLLEAVPSGGEGELVLAGGLDYDAEPGQAAAWLPEADAPPPARSGVGAVDFQYLPGTLAEVEAIVHSYRQTFGREAILLVGSEGTKSALGAAAPRARFLHLATHGWFAPEAFQSQLDGALPDSLDTLRRAGRTLIGFAPETLCGVALTGANRGKDAVDRVPGILTAEELASFDLRGCELAVLSACESNVGVRRAGQGIQSLQTALHAAGARTAITSLWRVDDESTRELMGLFYARLWNDRLGKAEALWQAKMELRAQGHPPRNWAGWVLTGDPE